MSRDLTNKPPLWVRYFPSNILDATAQMDDRTELAYRRIIDWIYATGGQLKDDDRRLSEMTKTGRRWKRIKAELLATGKLEVKGGLIYQDKCALEIQHSRAMSIRQSERRKGSEKTANGLANNETGSTTDPTVAISTDITVEPATDISAAPTLSEIRDSPIGELGGGDSARDLAERFCAMRLEHWPHESRFPAPMATLRSEARSLLDRGGTPDLIAEILERNMRRAAGDGRPAPGSFKAYGDTLANAIVSFMKPMPEGSHDIKPTGYVDRQDPAYRAERAERQREQLQAGTAQGLARFLEAQRAGAGSG